jgi:hypothetical protein
MLVKLITQERKKEKENRKKNELSQINKYGERIE